jgi:hypothetical protein
MNDAQNLFDQNLLFWRMEYRWKLDGLQAQVIVVGLSMVMRKE